ncbi:MAG: YncE family protein [Clostridium sp.]
MNNIVLCDSTRSLLIKCDIDSAKLEAVPLASYGKPCAPHDLIVGNDKIYVANSISNTISIIDKKTFMSIDSIYGGSIPEDVLLVSNYLFVACGGTNSVDVLDVETLNLLVTIPVKNFPHCLAYDSYKNRVFVANFIDSSISVIDVNTLNEVTNIKSKFYPTKILISQKYNMLICCESCLGDKHGYLELYSLSNLKSIKKIELGKNPIDMCIDEEKIYVTNFDDGTISVIRLIDLFLEGAMFIGGNLRGICKVDKYLCVGDKKNLKLIICDLERCAKKIIALGGEPNAIKSY